MMQTFYPLIPGRPGVPDKKNLYRYEEWETVQIAVLPPGYRNVFRDDLGKEEVAPCPALLLQELRNASEDWEIEKSDGTREKLNREFEYHPPFRSRVVYAYEDDSGAFEATCENELYRRTLYPDEKSEPQEQEPPLLTAAKQT